MDREGSSLRAIFFALGANLAIAVAKTAAAVYTGSGSMLAEAIHSLADSGNQALLLLGLHQARKPPSPDYPLGHGKAVYFWSFIVALMLFSMGGLFSIYEGWHKLHQPEAIVAPWLAILILVFSLAAEAMSLRACLRVVNHVRGERSLWRWFRDSRQSELIVVFGEDVAAMAGLSVALVAVLLSALTGNPWFDALGSMVIGMLLVLVALFVGYEVKGLLIGQSVDADTKRAILGFLGGHAEVAEVLNLITLQLGDEMMVAVKARMREEHDARALVEAVNRCERDLRGAFPAVKWIFFEPDFGV